MTGHPTPELTLELAAAGAAPEEGLREQERARVAALRAENQAFTRVRDPVAFARRVAVVAEAARDERRSRSARLALFAPAFAAAALFVFVVRPDPAGLGDPALSAAVRLKGEATADLLVARVTGERYAPLASGDGAQRGDVLQLKVSGLPAGHRAMVLSIDGRGAVTLHYPATPGEALEASGEVPRAFQLDDAPGFERFFLVTGAQFDPAGVLASAQRLADSGDASFGLLSLPDGVSQRAVLLDKKDP